MSHFNFCRIFPNVVNCPNKKGSNQKSAYAVGTFYCIWKKFDKNWNETFLVIFKHCVIYLLMLVAEWLWNVICLAKKVSKYSSFHVHKSHKIGLVLLPNSWWWLILLSFQDWGSQEEQLPGVPKLIIAGFLKDRVIQKNISI